MRKQKESLNVKCNLTDSEKLSYSRQLAERISNRQRSEDSLKAFRAQVGSEIAGHEAQINLLSEKINNGFEYRFVDCSIEYDWEKKIKRWRRSDTGEIEREDIIPERELQEELEVAADASHDGDPKPEVDE